MFKITTLFVIFACLTTAFALNATLTKNFFFVNSYNKLSYKLFHTSNGIIAYNLESSLNGPIPQYVLLDPISGSASPILTDLLSSCGQVGGVVFDRLYYHVQTSALVYFCTANNSLLILDERTYAVHDAIPTGISEKFAESKLTSDGNDVYVLLMGTLYEMNQTSSQLVEINVPARTVTRKIVFEEGFGDQEFVNGFVSQNQEAFALTNHVDDQGLTTVSIYSLNLTGNTYESVKLKNFSYHANPNYLSQLFLLGDILVTNDIGNLYFLNKQGQTVSNYILVTSKSFGTVPQIPAIIAQEGSCFLYVQFYQEILVKFTAQGDNILYDSIGTVFDFQIAYGNRYTSDLLLTIDVAQQNFTITNLQSSELVYSALTSYQDFVITNSTYGIVKSGIIYVYNRRSNALIGSVSLPVSYQINYDTDTIYFTKTEAGYSACDIMQLDLTTLNVQEVKQYFFIELCQGTISQFKLSDLGHPEFVVSNSFDNDFLVVSSTYGVVDFDRALFSTEAELIVPNYETMSFYQIQSDPSGNTTQVSYYEYNYTGTVGNLFILKDSYDIASSASSFYPVGTQKVIAVRSGSFSVIDLEYGSTTDYSFPTNTKTVSSFEDNAGRKHIIFSDIRTAGDWKGTFTPPSLFDLNGVSQLPGTNNFTVQAGAAGKCAYWIVDGYISSVGVVKFYDACAKEGMSSISL